MTENESYKRWMSSELERKECAVEFNELTLRNIESLFPEDKIRIEIPGADSEMGSCLVIRASAMRAFLKSQVKRFNAENEILSKEIDKLKLEIQAL